MRYTSFQLNRQVSGLFAVEIYGVMTSCICVTNCIAHFSISGCHTLLAYYTCLGMAEISSSISSFTILTTLIHYYWFVTVKLYRFQNYSWSCLSMIKTSSATAEINNSDTVSLWYRCIDSTDFISVTGTRLCAQKTSLYILSAALQVR